MDRQTDRQTEIERYSKNIKPPGKSSQFLFTNPATCSPVRPCTLQSTEFFELFSIIFITTSGIVQFQQFDSLGN